MPIKEQDRRCDILFLQLDMLKAQGHDKVKNGEYDRVLLELLVATRERLREG